MHDLDVARAKKQIIEFIRQNAPANGVILGISGGIDSALVLTLCVEALGKDKVFGMFMPEAESSISNTIREYADKLGVQYEIIPIEPLIEAYTQHGDVSEDQKVSGNLKARIRMSLLYSRSNAKELVVMGTGNRSELLAGYFTKYGDGGVDFLPIGDLYKTHVRLLAAHVGVPEPIITQPPSAGLWEGQTDEEELGITYEKLDQILYEHFDNDTPFDKISLPDITADDVQLVAGRTANAAFKLTMPPVCQIQ
jgi:NAD+ synthase